MGYKQERGKDEKNPAEAGRGVENRQEGCLDIQADTWRAAGIPVMPHAGVVPIGCILGVARQTVEFLRKLCHAICVAAPSAARNIACIACICIALV